MKSLRATSAAAVAGLALLGVSACGDGTASNSGDGLRVLTSIYPLQYVTERIAGDAATVTNLVPPGSEPHAFELSARDIAAVADADLVVYLKDFQPAVDEAIASEASESAFDVAPHARLLSASDTSADDHKASDHQDGGQEGDQESAEDSHSEDGHAEDEHADDEHAEDEHGHGDTDPHFWLDPTRLADVADELAAELADRDPDHAQAYTANAEELRADLSELDKDFTAALEGCANTDLVTSHTAFGYLAHRYGLTQIGISGLSTESEPNTRELGEIAELVREHGVNTVYYETLVPPDVAEVVAGEAGVDTAVLDPIEGITDQSAGEDYLQVMRANLDSLVENQPCR